VPRALVLLILAIATTAHAAPTAERLPDSVVPLAYTVALDLDPDAPAFRGEVTIRVRFTAPTLRFWLHAQDLDITRATANGEALVADGAAATPDTRAFHAAHPLGPGEVTLAFAYSGKVATPGYARREYAGLFREQQGKRWYLFSQGEAADMRRIIPCFDEPRWKVPWQLTVRAPKADLVASNMAAASDTRIAGGRHEVRFQSTLPLPSYLVALAVGPFTVVDAGSVGRARVHARILVAPEDAGGVAGMRGALPGLVAQLEGYFGSPLPWGKLDLVAVPHFFGAMENPGLTTVERKFLVDASGRIPDEATHVVGHELVHYWFGDLVTPAWWDDLWLSEAFATWLEGELATGDRRKSLDDPMVAHEQRTTALDADLAVHAALRRPVSSPDEAEDNFSAIAYEKGAAVLGTFERFIDRDGGSRFRDAVRAFVTSHARGSVTAADFIAALRDHCGADIAAAFETAIAKPGTPIVDFELRSAPGAMIAMATARDGFIVPVCVRGAAGRQCALVGGPTQLDLGDPTTLEFFAPNIDGRGYYLSAMRAPIATLARVYAPAFGVEGFMGERLALGDDLVGMWQRGELPVVDLLALAKSLADNADPYSGVAGLTLAGELDRIVGAADRAAWRAWLGRAWSARFSSVATTPDAQSDVRSAVRIMAARLVGDRVPALVSYAKSAPRVGGMLIDPVAIHVLGTEAEFDRVASSRIPGYLKAPVLAEFDGPYVAPDLVRLALAGELPASDATGALEELLGRSATAASAWAAMRAHLPELIALEPPGQGADLIRATFQLCDPSLRADIAAAFTPLAPTLPEGPATLARALASMDACIARGRALPPLAPLLK
jgi:alanyl aminopeptidase